MNTPYQTYIFDLDGTLLNTITDLYLSCNAALQAFGLPPRSLEEVTRFVGNGVRLLMERAIPQGALHPRFDEIFEAFRTHYSAHHLDHTAPYPEVMATLQTLKQKGCGLAVVSNKYDEATKDLCSHFFGDIIDVAVGEREGVQKKPAPDTVFEVLRVLDADKATAVYVGDSDVDVQTAANAGLPCISVLWGFRDQAFLERSGARCFIRSMSEILSVKV